MTDEQQTEKVEIKVDTEADRVAPPPFEKSTVGQTKPASAGLVILQWLTYAFWGWTLLAMIWLVYIVLASFIEHRDMADMVPYAIAASLVLLPIAFVCDLFYSRRETVKKTGAAMVVMIIHAVLFALFGIGVLIGAVFLLVNLLIEGRSDTTSQWVWIMTLLVSAVLYAGTFMRTLNPFSGLRLGKIYAFAMLGIVGLFIVLGFVGPVAQAGLARDDSKIVDELSNIHQEVSRVTEDTKQLPKSLDELDLSPQQRDLVDRQLITYRPVGTEYRKDSSRALDDALPSKSTVVYKYQLCANYKTMNGSSYDYLANGRSSKRDEYQSYLSVYSHPVGQVCYKLIAYEDISRVVL